jgi:hypothetical protein
MSQGAAVPYPVFSENSSERASQVFYVNKGWHAEFLALNFASRLVRPDPQRPMVNQAACLYRVLYKEFVLPEPDKDQCGGGILDLTRYRPEILAEVPLITAGCPWSLSYCDNYRQLDIPGTYRFVLNDPEAAGVVSIYMMAHPLPAWSLRPSRLYYGE